MDNKEKLLQCTSKLPKQLYGDAIRSCKTDWKQENTNATPLSYDYFVWKINKKYEEMSTAEEGKVSFLNLMASQTWTKNNDGGNKNDGGNENGGNGNDDQICPNYGKTRHTQKQCSQKDEGCNHCGRDNHVESNCFLKYPHLKTKILKLQKANYNVTNYRKKR